MNESPTTDEQVLNYVLDSLKTNKEITDTVLKRELNRLFGINSNKRMQLMTRLIESNIINAKTVNDQVIYYVVQKTDQAAKKNLDIEPKILELIRESKGEGVSNYDIKVKTKLNRNLITKVVKRLQKTGQVSSYKTKHRGRLIYVASEFMPDESLVGGNLFKNGEIDYEFVENINTVIERIIQEKGSCSYTEILGYLTSNEGKYLNEKEIQSIVNTMIVDKKICKDGDRFYIRKINKFLNNGEEKKLPCFNCPVFDFCGKGSVISPENCIYFESW